MFTFLTRAMVIAGVGTVAFGATAAAQTSPSPALSGDWTIGDVLKAALNQHPLIEAAKARLSAAEGARQSARALPNPMANYWVEDKEASIFATVPLEPFLQRGSRAAQASSDTRAAQASVTMAERQVASDAVRAFYRVALAQVASDAMRDTLAAIEQVVVYLRNRVAQGAAPEGDLIRAEVERDRAGTEVTMADVELIRAQSSLRVFVGESGPPGGIRVRTPEWARERPGLPPLAEFTSHALSQRADLLAARARTASASSALDVERSMVFRQLGASFGVKRMAGVTSMVGGVSLSLPLFDRNRGGVLRADGERLAADMERQWMERTIASEVEAEYQVAVRLVAQVTSLQPSFLSRAEESRRIALGAYQEGATSLLQVLDASRALSEARLTYARVSTAASQSLFDLGVAAGYDPRTASTNGGSR